MWWGGGSGLRSCPKGQEQRMKDATCRKWMRWPLDPQEEALTRIQCFSPGKPNSGFQPLICVVIDMPQVCGNLGLWEPGAAVPEVHTACCRCNLASQPAGPLWSHSGFLLLLCRPWAPLLEEPCGQRDGFFGPVLLDALAPRSSLPGAGDAPGLQHENPALPDPAWLQVCPAWFWVCPGPPGQLCPRLTMVTGPGAEPAGWGKASVFSYSKDRTEDPRGWSDSRTEGAWVLKDSK